MLISVDTSCPWPATSVRLGRVTGGYSGSLEKLGLIQSWTEDCVKNHKECQQAETPLPSRVIDVGEYHTDVLKLCIGRKSPARYCTLSHRVRFSNFA